MKQLSEIEKRVLRLIPKGIEKRVATAELCSVLHLNTRTVREIVGSLVKKGVPIVADRDSQHGGMFIPENDNERKKGLKQFKIQTEEMKTRIMLVEGIDLKHWQDEF